MPVGRRIQLPHTPNPAVSQSFSYFTKRGRPMLFQVTDPTNQPLWPYLLALHINPRSFNESFQKSKSVVMTYGGFVEFVWPDELDTITASASTGAFFGPFTGLTAGSDGNNQGNLRTSGFRRPNASGRQQTMAWERQEDLLDLFRNNGNIFNGAGQPVIRGRVMCSYDRGIYVGHFTTFSPREDDEHAFSFDLDWEFKVEQTVYLFPGATNEARPGDASGSNAARARANQANEDAFVNSIEQDQFVNGPPVEGASPEQVEGQFDEPIGPSGLTQAQAAYLFEPPP